MAFGGSFGKTDLKKEKDHSAKGMETSFIKNNLPRQILVKSV